MIVAALDIGGTKIAVGLVNEQGHLIAKEVMPTSAEAGLQNSLDRIGAAIRKMQQAQQVSIEGLGIACTGPVDPLTGSLSAANAFLPGWEGFGLVNGLRKQFDLPIAIENDADAAALAEGRWGAGKDSEVFLYVTVSTGIGSGLIIHQRLFRGVDGAHPEMGHHTVDPNGPACFCGAHGCWEVMASGPAMLRWFQQEAAGLSQYAQVQNAADICALAQAGDELAAKCVEREGTYLGLGIANLITLFTPNLIALGGGVMRSWPLFKDRVELIVRQNCGLVPHEKTRIELASLGSDVNLLGAGQAWFHRYHSK
ncbi:MAG: ROK family protein [Anaerolineaceae bacterium]|nr:ROK family protein [Anaerolineaceae bacterium]